MAVLEEDSEPLETLLCVCGHSATLRHVPDDADRLVCIDCGKTCGAVISHLPMIGYVSVPTVDGSVTEFTFAMDLCTYAARP